jgi:uncharacterized protein (DUF1697 family)
MGRYVALLRGINVGRAKRVAMADLRLLLSEAGFEDVSTLLNSGNVVFSSTRTDVETHAANIRKALQDKSGVDAAVVVLSSVSVDAIIASNPLRKVATEPSRLLVAFAQKAASLSALKELAARDWSPERLEIGKLAAYLWCPEGVIASKAIPAVERALDDGVTMRNWGTLEKIQTQLG